MSVKKQKLPLPKDFFRPPPLSEVERFHYIRSGQQALIEFVEKVRLRGGPITWTFDHEVNGVLVYRGIDKTLPMPHQRVYLNVTEVQATMDEAASIMSAGPDGQRDYCATYHRDHIIDMKNIYVIATPSQAHPHNSISIKWRAVSAKNPLIKCRDMVFMEYCDDFIIDGVKGFGRCMNSIEMGPVVPNLEKSFDLVRSHMWVGGDIFLKNEQRNGYLTAFRIYQQDIKGSLPPWIVTRIFKKKISQCMASMDRNFRNERVLALQASLAFLPEHARIPLQARTNCALCTTKFYPLNRRSHCFKCGEVLCKTCNRVWDLGGNGLGHRIVKVCNSCTSSHSATLLSPNLRRPYQSVHLNDTRFDDDLYDIRRTKSDHYAGEKPSIRSRQSNNIYLIKSGKLYSQRQTTYAL